MPTDTLERDFLRFQRTRDPDALAAVFDAAAPRLLLVAMHLCRDAAAAEDLVQTVFLQALRDVDRFDARRPVMPWLLGMLEHRASDHRGRAHRRRELAGPGTGIDGVAGNAPTPEREAMDAEVRQRLAEALAGMPREYRDVLTLRLVHGLAAVDIAHAHGLPPATVRTRLRRGLELLRGALPRGMATPGLLALLGAELLRARDGLAAVRAHVLAAAAGTGAVWGLGLWSLFAAGVLLLLGGWQWWRHAEAVPATVADAVLPVSMLSGEPPDTIGQPSVPPTLAERQPAESLVAPREARFSGRVIDAGSGRPVLDATVGLRGSFVFGRGEPPADWRDPEAVRVDRDGRFQIAVLPSPTMSIELVFRSPTHVMQWRGFDPLREGAAIDLGDVSMQSGTAVRVRLLVGAEPLGGVECFASHAPDGAEPNGMEGHGPSDRDGFLDLGVCLPGTWYYEVQTAHLGHTGRFTVPLQSVPFEATIALREPPRERSISGVLVDTRGEPVPGVRLAIRASSHGHFVATTRLDGRFLFAVAAVADPKARIELMGDRPDLEWAFDGGEITWGSNDLQLVVRRRAPASLRVEVVDAANGQPVETFAVSCWRNPWAPGARGGPKLKRPPAAAHEGGIATLDGLAAGACFVSVFPPAPWAEQAELPVMLAEGQLRTLRIGLVRPATLDVLVTEAATGAPLAGIELALAKVLPAERRPQVKLGDFRVELAAARAGQGHSSAQNTIVLARAISDAAGRAALQAPPDLPGLVLFAEGPNCVATLRADVELPTGGATTSIAVVPAAKLRGVLGPRTFVERCGPAPGSLAAAAAKAATQWTDPQEFAEHWPRIELRAVGAERSLGGVHVAADGSFALGGVPDGRYEVWVCATARDDDGDHAWTADLGPLTTLDLRSGAKEGAVRLDASRFVPACATLRFFVDGQPWHGEAGLVMPGDGTQVLMQTAADGAVVTPWLRPGAYVPFVHCIDANGERQRIAGSDRFVVEPGRDVEATCTLQRRRLEITVRDAHDRPVCARWLVVEPIDAPEVYVPPLCTDAEGRIVLDPAPPGRLRLRAHAADWRRDSEDAPVHELGEVEASATRVHRVLGSGEN